MQRIYMHSMHSIHLAAWLNRTTWIDEPTRHAVLKLKIFPIHNHFSRDFLR